MSAFVTAGLLSTTAVAQKPNACTYTNTATGSSRTFCGECSNDTAGVTSTAVHVSACGSATPPKVEAEVLAQEDQVEGEGDPGGGNDPKPGKRPKTSK